MSSEIWQQKYTPRGKNSAKLDVFVFFCFVYKPKMTDITSLQMYHGYLLEIPLSKVLLMSTYEIHFHGDKSFYLTHEFLN